MMRVLPWLAAALCVSVAAQTPPPWPAEAIQAMARARAAALADKARLAPLKRSAPARYATEYSAVLARWEEALEPYSNVTQSVGSRQELASEYLQLGAFLRFDAGRSDDALVAYESARRARPPQTPDLAALAIADIQRFDKHANRKALEQYRLAMASFDAAQLSESEAVLAAGLKRWLEYEIAFLERGQRFAGGTLGRSDAGTAQFWLMIGAMAPVAPLDERALARLSASQFQIARHYATAIGLEPRAMLAFFAKHDPAGYLTAATLTLALYLQPSPYVKAAAQTFFASRGITGPGAKPDARYATPEKTWSAFIAAAKKGDADAMLDCFTPTMQARLGELFKRMSAQERRAMAESFVGFALQESIGGDYREAVIARQVKDKRMAGFVTFLNDAGAWKIDAM